MRESAIQLLAFALVVYAIGYWGQSTDRWDFRVFLFAFAIPAGFFFGWSVIQVVFPYLPVLEQIAITGGASLMAAALSFAVLHFAQVR